jgi:RNA polymerase sigma-70 factor (ECF subfamily)
MSDEVDTELLHKLETAVANLTRAQQVVFLAHCCDRLSYKEIAFVTGLSVRQVEGQMARAIAKIAKQLDGEKLIWRDRWL